MYFAKRLDRHFKIWYTIFIALGEAIIRDNTVRCAVTKHGRQPFLKKY